MRTLHVIHCFDDNYVLPAAVSFRSLLENAKAPDTLYALHVVGDMSARGQDLLRAVASPFPQATLDFRPAPPLPAALANAIGAKSHYSAALFCKLLLPDVFPELDRAIALDVDTVYCGDIAEPFTRTQTDGALIVASPEPLYFGWRGEGPAAGKARKVRRYWRDFTAAERARMTMNAGFAIFDFARARREDAVARWVKFAVDNARRLVLPEQDVFNLATEHPPKTLGWDTVAYAPSADPEAAARAVQVHYTTRVKPWNDPGCNLAELWFAALARANLVEEWRRRFAAATRGMFAEKYARPLFACRAGRLSFKLVKFAKERTCA